MNRIRAGYCFVPHPVRVAAGRSIGLAPEEVSGIVFWTRNPAPLLRCLPELDRKGYAYYFLCTLIGYPRVIDPAAPSAAQAIKTFCDLSRRIGKNRVIWRYDPIIFSSRTPESWHKARILRIAGGLEGYTERVIVSIIDPYRRTKLRLAAADGGRNAPAANAFEPQAYVSLLRWIAPEMKKRGIEMQTCAEDSAVARAAGISPGRCIDERLIGALTGEPLSYKKDPGQRPDCACHISADIGAYNTCVYGCKYCYAVSGVQAAKRNFKNYDADAEALTAVSSVTRGEQNG